MASFISLTDLIYPVNSVYISVNSTSPGSRFGGTWTAINGALRAGSNINQNFGSDTCTLTTSQIPSHTHNCTSTGRMTNISLGAGYTCPVINTYGDLNTPQTGNTGGGGPTPSCNTVLAFTLGRELLDFLGEQGGQHE